MTYEERKRIELAKPFREGSGKGGPLRYNGQKYPTLKAQREARREQMRWNSVRYRARKKARLEAEQQKHKQKGAAA